MGDHLYKWLFPLARFRNAFLFAATALVCFVTGALSGASVVQNNLQHDNRLLQFGPFLSDEFVETTEGVGPAEVRPGVAKADIEFLTPYRGALLEKAPSDPLDYREQLRLELTKGFESVRRADDRHYAGLSPRQQLVLFLLLRVNGSMPTYFVAPAPPSELNEILLSHRGNCSDHAARLSAVLDVFDIQTSMVSIFTPSLPGHVIVDAYDPVERTAYLLDSNTNVMVVKPESKASVLTQMVALSKDERAGFFKKLHWVDVPVYFRFVDPGRSGLKSTPVTVDLLNDLIPGSRHALWEKTFTAEFDEITAWWRKVFPKQPPRNLADLFAWTHMRGLQELSKNALSTAPLWKAAGLPVDDNPIATGSL